MKYKYEIIAPIVGILLGYITIHSFFANSWLSLVLWAVVGILLAVFIGNRKDAVMSGALYGLFLCFFWLQFGFQGSSGKHVSFILFSAFLSIIAAAIASGGFILVGVIKSKFTKQ